MADTSAARGFFKAALNVFVETDDDKATPTAATAPVTARPSTTSAPVSAVDPDMVATLQKVIDSRKTPYTALLEASQKLASVIPDETQRLKAAFVTVSGDRSLGDIVKAIDVHVSDLEGQVMRFRQTTAAQISTKVGAKRAQVETFTAEAERNKTEIDRLTARNVEIGTQVQTLTAQADADEQEIGAVETRFEAAVTFLTNNLTATKQHLSSVLS
jgi:outer membrane murein-binding lipoprotein Lpp